MIGGKSKKDAGKRKRSLPERGGKRWRRGSNERGAEDWMKGQGGGRREPKMVFEMDRATVAGHPKPIKSN